MRQFVHEPGSRPIEGYTIRRGIHRGGFGEVYYAVSDGGKEVALKLIQEHEHIELRGVRQCLNLKHPHLVTIFDVKTDAHGDSWVVMEYVSGSNLENVLTSFPQGLPLAEVRDWLTGLAAGVAYLHDQGIVHRDLKPANVFREHGIVKIGDVGLSKRLDGPRTAPHTGGIGTVYYMAPEIGHGRYGLEVDIYSLAAITYEMLTGRLLFEGESVGEILIKHLSSPPDLSALTPALRGPLERALRKDPRDRTHSVRTFADQMLSALEQLSPQEAGTTRPKHDAAEIPESAFLPDDRMAVANAGPRDQHAAAVGEAARSPADGIHPAWVAHLDRLTHGHFKQVRAWWQEQLRRHRMPHQRRPHGTRFDASPEHFTGQQGKPSGSTPNDHSHPPGPTKLLKLWQRWEAVQADWRTIQSEWKAQHQAARVAERERRQAARAERQRQRDEQRLARAERRATRRKRLGWGLFIGLLLWVLFTSKNFPALALIMMAVAGVLWVVQRLAQSADEAMADDLWKQLQNLRDDGAADVGALPLVALRTNADRMREWAWSCLIAVPVIVVIPLGLYGICVYEPGPFNFRHWPRQTELSAAWVIAVSLTMTWGLLALTKMWERHPYRPVTRRLMLLGLAAASATVAFVPIAWEGLTFGPEQFCGTPFQSRLQTLGIHPLTRNGFTPTWLGHFACFSALLCVNRWWLDTNRFRPDRLRIMSIVFPFGVMLLMTTILLPYAQLLALQLGVTVSLATQLTASWVPPLARERFSAETPATSLSA